jgi:phi13 family phage major tail protein
MANKNLVQFGLSNIAIAQLEEGENGATPTWGTPVMWPGAVSISMDAAVEEAAKYADNRRYWGQYIDQGYTGELEVMQMLEAFATMALGWYVDELGGLVERNNGIKSNFAIMGQFEGDKHGARWVLYNCQAGKPSSEASTTEDTTEPETQTIPYNAAPIQIADGITATKYTLFDDPGNPAAHAAYQGWFSQVTLPVPKVEG